jgi:type IV secretion system protein VirD4
MRLLIQQAITVNARNIERKPERPILFLLDEMAAIGRLASVEQAYGLMAGFGMQLWGIVQDLSQLARIYGEHGWQTFISNSGVIQYFGSRDKMTAEYFSTLCGVTTVEIHNFSWAISKMVSYARSFTSGQGGGSTSSSSSSGTTETSTSGTNEAQRQLAYPDELMVLKGHQQIIFIENLDPIAAEKLVWYRVPALKQHGVDLHAADAQPTLKIAKAA